MNLSCLLMVIHLQNNDKIQFLYVQQIQIVINTNSTSRRKSRKPIKNLQESINNNENKTSQIDEDTQSISFIDEDDQIPTHSLNNNNTYL